jgi:hypothetical protein
VPATMLNQWYFVGRTDSLRTSSAEELLVATTCGAKRMCWFSHSLMAAARTVASQRTASLSYLMATARCPFEAIDAALDRVPGLVVLRIELGRTAREPRFFQLRAWSALSGTVQRMPRLRRDRAEPGAPVGPVR